MPSTLPAKSAYAAHTLSILSLLVAITTTHAHAHSPSLLSRSTGVKRGLNAMTYQGCFSSSSGLSDQGSYTYQTSGYCQPICVKANQAVLGLSGGSDCWCGDVLPPADSKVDDSNCDSPCNGYDKENCGGNNFWSVYLSGTESSVPNSGGSDNSGSASSADSTPASTETSAATSAASAPTSGSQTTTAPPQVITSVAPGKTVVVTMPATQDAGQSSSPTPTPEKKSGGGTNVAGVAAGVVVGVLAAAALAAGLILWIRHRKRQAAEEEYKRSNQVADFMRGSHSNEPKPPPTAYSQMSDSRLDPEANARRNSAGSIADDQDYSRRILRVANPDHS